MHRPATVPHRPVTLVMNLRVKPIRNSFLTVANGFQFTYDISATGLPNLCLR